MELKKEYRNIQGRDERTQEDYPYICCVLLQV